MEVGVKKLQAAVLLQNQQVVGMVVVAVSAGKMAILLGIVLPEEEGVVGTINVEIVGRKDIWPMTAQSLKYVADVEKKGIW